MLERLYDMLGNILGGIPNIIMAVLLALLAWVLAAVVRKIIISLGQKLKLPDYFQKMHVVADAEKGASLLKTLGSLGFFVVFLIMLPPVFDALGMVSLSAPISGMVTTALSFLPNVLGAALLVFIGYLLAKIAKEVISGIAAAFGLDKLVNKFNSDSEGEYAASALLGNIVFALIIIPTVITALQILKLEAVARPAMDMLSNIMLVVPNIIVCIILVLIGVFIAKMVSKIAVGFFANMGVDKLSKSAHFESIFKTHKPSAILGSIIYVIIVAVFMFQAISVLHLALLTNIANAILAYLPNVIGALLILIVAYFAASYIAKFVQNITNSKLLATITKALIYVFALFMTLNQLALAPQIVLTAFTFTLGAIALAFVIAFGIGGKDFAKKQLERLDHKIDE